MSAVTKYIVEEGSAEERRDRAAREKKERPVRKRQRVYGEKVCQVCGDKALAHHFGALACETCKAFFRRNAAVKEPRKCLFNGGCSITVNTRRFCPACRLAKCFQVGMQADLILDEEEKKERWQKVNEKRLKKDQQKHLESNEIHTAVCDVSTTGRDIACSPEQASGMIKQPSQTVFKVRTADPTMMKNPAYLSADDRWPEGSLSEDSRQNVEIIITNTNPMTEDSQMSMLSSDSQTLVPPTAMNFSSPSTSSTPATPAHYPSQPGQSTVPASPPQSAQLSADSSKSSKCFIVEQKLEMLGSFQHIPREDLPSDPHMYWRLSEEERCLLTQLSTAYQDTLLSTLQSSPPKDFVPQEHLNMEVFIDMCETDAHSAVNFAKRMEDFRQLRTDEQIALLKASTDQALGIQGGALFIAEKDAWWTQLGYVSVEQCHLFVPDTTCQNVFLYLSRSLKNIVKNDVTLYALLHCITLFDPCDERIIDRQLINSIHDKYIIMLKHYLQSVYSYSHSEKYMMALQENLLTYRIFSQEGKHLFRKWFPRVSNKLIAEVWELD